MLTVHHLAAYLPAPASRDNYETAQSVVVTDPVPTQATQLRLEFAPAPPSRLYLDVSGLTLLVDSDRPESDLFTYLASRGFEPEFRPGIGVSVPARLLSRFAELEIPVATSELLRPVWLLASDPPSNNLPATVERGQHAYVVSWESMTGTAYDESVHLALAPLLGFADLTIVATDDVWLTLERDLPTLGPSGTASLTADGYISITTSKPQILEASKIPGLFRTSASSFGVCTAFAEYVTDEPGIRWAGPRPTHRDSSIQAPRHLTLAPHLTDDLPLLTAGLTQLGSKAVIWESGLGRRVLVLAALEVLDAYPATVLCPPHAIWLWRRHVEMVSRTCGLSNEHCDVQLITYHDLHRRRLEPQAIVFDDLASNEAHAAWGALRRLHHLTDVYRIAVEDTWPEDPVESQRLMEVLRPAEFRTDVSVAERYPVDPYRRLHEHVEVYLARRTRSETVDLRRFRRSSVRVVSISPAQEVTIAEAARRAVGRAPEQVLAEILELVSVGPATSLSPKIAAAAEIARQAIQSGRSVALVTRHPRAAQMLRTMLRPNSVSLVDAPSPYLEVPKVPAVVVRFDTYLPLLRAFDEVVVLDYPWSLQELDRSVGPAPESEGPDVVVVHATDTTDDRLAVLAARRSEYGELAGGNVPPTLTEIAYLLSPRR